MASWVSADVYWKGHKEPRRRHANTAAGGVIDERKEKERKSKPGARRPPPPEDGPEESFKHLSGKRMRRSRRSCEEEGGNALEDVRGKMDSLTFSGVFLASGNSLSSRRSQRWRNCWTMGLSRLMIWKPVMLAPPENTLSRLMLEKPWDQRETGKGTLQTCPKTATPLYVTPPRALTRLARM